MRSKKNGVLEEVESGSLRHGLEELEPMFSEAKDEVNMSAADPEVGTETETKAGKLPLQLCGSSRMTRWSKHTRMKRRNRYTRNNPFKARWSEHNIPLMAWSMVMIILL